MRAFNDEDAVLSSADLSEAQRIEARRRMDSCYAVVAELQDLVPARERQRSDIKDAGDVAGAKWPMALLIGGAALAWAGNRFDLPVTVIGYSVAGFGFLVLLRAVHDDWSARRALRETELAIDRMRFYWRASGAGTDAFYAYCREITKDGASTDLIDHPDIYRSMRREVFACVRDY